MSSPQAISKGSVPQAELAASQSFVGFNLHRPLRDTPDLAPLKGSPYWGMSDSSHRLTLRPWTPRTTTPRATTDFDTPQWPAMYRRAQPQALSNNCAGARTA